MKITMGVSTSTLWLIVRYAITGVTVAGMYVGVYFLLRNSLSFSPSLSSGISITLAVVLQYILHSAFTFRRDLADANQLVKFIVSVVISLVVSDIFVARLGAALGISEFVRLIFVMVVLPIANFLLFAFWVYAAKEVSNTNTELH